MGYCSYFTPTYTLLRERAGFAAPVSVCSLSCTEWQVSIQEVHDLIDVKAERASIQTYTLPITFNPHEYKT